MSNLTAQLKMLARKWRWILVVAILFAIPSLGFTVPASLAVTAFAVAVALYLLILLSWGEGHVIEGALFLILPLVLCAMLSHAYKDAIENRDKIKQQQL